MQGGMQHCIYPKCGNPEEECANTVEDIKYGLEGCAKDGCDISVGCDTPTGPCGEEYSVSVLPTHSIQLIKIFRISG